VLKSNYAIKNNKIITAGHPGYKYNIDDKKKYFGTKYLKLLSQSHFMITDTTDLNIPLIKHLECMYYGCVMVCDKIYYEKKNKLKNGYNYIKVDRKNIDKTIKYLKKNKHNMIKIRKNAFKTYQNYYSNKIFVKRVESYFELIANDNNKKIFTFNNTDKFILKFKILILNTIKLTKKIFYKMLGIKKFVY